MIFWKLNLIVKIFEIYKRKLKITFAFIFSLVDYCVKLFLKGKEIYKGQINRFDVKIISKVKKMIDIKSICSFLKQLKYENKNK